MRECHESHIVSSSPGSVTWESLSTTDVSSPGSGPSPTWTSAWGLLIRVAIKLHHLKEGVPRCDKAMYSHRHESQCRFIIPPGHLDALVDDGRVVTSLQVLLNLALVLGVVDQRLLLSLSHGRLIVSIYYLAFLSSLLKEKL